jgi:hypothetical protein
MTAETKVIVTNWGALESKYGRRVGEITEALNTLIGADRLRGLTTTVVRLDDSKDMLDYGPVITQPDNPQQAKKAIDDVYRVCRPDHLMILGAVDVVPHQPLSCHKCTAPDTNLVAYSDLPYACDAGYDTKIATFAGPTRSVGRLPDITGHPHPWYLVSLLDSAAAARPLPAPDESACLAISTKKCATSTKKNLADVFRVKTFAQLQVSPRKGPDWHRDFLARPVHYINCHGGKSDCRYYGEGASEKTIDDFVAHDSACVAGRLTPGTVAIAECCYGARLSDPAGTAGILTICNTYLASGAVAFFGSSTAAYGGDSTVEHADVLCKYFLEHLLAGETSGDAVWAARLDFVEHTDTDLIQEKTLAQFGLMGDPSVQPFLGPDEKPGPFMAEARAPYHAGLAAQRTASRAALAARSEELGRRPTVSHEWTQAPQPEVTIKSILRAAGVAGWRDPELESFVQSATLADDQPPAAPTLIHVVTRPRKERNLPFEDIEIIVAREVGGEIVSVSHLFSR